MPKQTYYKLKNLEKRVEIVTVKSYSEEEVANMLELIYVVENRYDIDWEDLEERFEGTDKMYAMFESIYESPTGKEEFGYRSEIYYSRYQKEVVESVLKEMKVDFKTKY